MSRKKVACLELLGKKHPIYEGLNVLGREVEATVVLGNIKYSKKHAFISVIGDKHYITDFKSSNGTKREDEQLTPYIFYEIHNGTKIILADSVGTYYTNLDNENLSNATQSQLSETVMLADTQVWPPKSLLNNTSTSEKELVLCEDTFDDNMDESLYQINETFEDSMVIPSTQDCINDKYPKDIGKKLSRIQENDSGSETDMEIDIKHISDNDTKKGIEKEKSRVENFKVSCRNNQVNSDNEEYDLLGPQEPTSELLLENNKDLPLSNAPIFEDEDSNESEDLLNPITEFVELNNSDPSVINTSKEQDITQTKQLENKIIDSDDETQDFLAPNIDFSTPNEPLAVQKNTNLTDDDDFCVPTQILEPPTTFAMPKQPANNSSKPSEDNDDNFCAPTQLLVSPTKTNQSTKLQKARDEAPEDDFCAPTQHLESPIKKNQSTTLPKARDEAPDDFCAPTQLLESPIKKNQSTTLPKARDEAPEDDFCAPTQLLESPTKKNQSTKLQQARDEAPEDDFCAPTQLLESHTKTNQSTKLSKARDEAPDDDFCAATQLLESPTKKNQSTKLQQARDEVPDDFCAPTQLLESPTKKNQSATLPEASDVFWGEDDFCAPIQLIKSPTKTNLSIKVQKDTEEDEFCAPTQIFEPPSSFVTPKQADISKTMEDEFLAPTQILSPKTKDNFVKPNQPEISKQTEDEVFCAPTQILESPVKKNNFAVPKSPQTTDFSAPTQILDTPKTKNLPYQTQNSDVFCVPTQILGIKTDAADSDEEFCAPTQLLGTKHFATPKNQKLRIKSVNSINRNKSGVTQELNENVKCKIDFLDDDDEDFLAPTQELFNNSINKSPQKEKLSEVEKNSDSDSGSDVEIKKKRAQTIKETQEYNSDDSDIVLRKKKISPIKYTQVTQTAENQKNISITSDFSFNTMTPNSPLEESMRLFVEESDVEKSKTETQLELDLPTQKEFNDSQNSRPKNPIISSFNTQESQIEKTDKKDKNLSEFVNLLNEECDQLSENDDYRNMETQIITDTPRSDLDDDYCNAATQPLESQSSGKKSGRVRVKKDFSDYVTESKGRQSSPNKSEETKSKKGKKKETGSEKSPEKNEKPKRSNRNVKVSPEAHSSKSTILSGEESSENSEKSNVLEEKLSRRTKTTNPEASSSKSKDIEENSVEEKIDLDVHSKRTKKSGPEHLNISKIPYLDEKNKALEQKNSKRTRNTENSTLKTENIEQTSAQTSSKVEPEPKRSRRTRNTVQKTESTTETDKNITSVAQNLEKTSDKVEPEPKRSRRTRNTVQKTENTTETDKNVTSVAQNLEKISDKVESEPKGSRRTRNTVQKSEETVENAQNLPQSNQQADKMDIEEPETKRSRSTRNTVQKTEDTPQKSVQSSSNEQILEKSVKIEPETKLKRTRNIVKKTEENPVPNTAEKRSKRIHELKPDVPEVETKKTRRQTIVPENVPNLETPRSRRGKSLHIPSTSSTDAQEPDIPEVETKKTKRQTVLENVPNLETPRSRRGKSSHIPITSNTDATEPVKRATRSITPDQKPTLPIETSKRDHRKTAVTKPKVVFTMLDDANLEAIVRRLGGALVNSSQECTVLVTNKVSRSLKFLTAVSLGKPIVGSNWVIQSGKEHHFLSPWDFILQDPESEKRFSFNLNEAIQIGMENNIMEGYNFQLAVSKNADVLKDVIATCGGKTVTKPPVETKNFFIISYPENKIKYGRFLKMKPPLTVVGAEAIFASALSQKLDLKSHILT